MDAKQKPVTVARMDELPPGQRKLIFIDGKSIVLFNIDGTIHAIDNSCPHNGASLASGKLEGTFLQCPAHGLRFDLAKPVSSARHACACVDMPYRRLETA